MPKEPQQTDLVSAIADFYPVGSEGSAYSSFLCDFMLWCRRHRISPLRLASDGFQHAGYTGPTSSFPAGWKISAWIEDKPERLPDSEQENIADQHADRISRFEGVMYKLYREINSEEPAVGLMSLFFQVVQDWDVMIGYLRSSSEQWLSLIPWGAISGEQWYTIEEVRRFMKDRTTANRAFFELGLNPSVPDATVSGSQLIEWVVKNGGHPGVWENETRENET